MTNDSSGLPDVGFNADTVLALTGPELIAFFERATQAYAAEVAFGRLDHPGARLLADELSIEHGSFQRCQQVEVCVQSALAAHRSDLLWSPPPASDMHRLVGRASRLSRPPRGRRRSERVLSRLSRALGAAGLFGAPIPFWTILNLRVIDCQGERWGEHSVRSVRRSAALVGMAAMFAGGPTVIRDVVRPDLDVVLADHVDGLSREAIDLARDAERGVLKWPNAEGELLRRGHRVLDCLATPPVEATVPASCATPDEPPRTDEPEPIVEPIVGETATVIAELGSPPDEPIEPREEPPLAREQGVQEREEPPGGQAEPRVLPTSWDELGIVRHGTSVESVLVVVGGEQRVWTLQELCCADRRGGGPGGKFALLLEVLDRPGGIPKPCDRCPDKQRKLRAARHSAFRRLNAALCEAFRLHSDGNPIRANRKTGRYAAQFKTRLR